MKELPAGLVIWSVWLWRWVSEYTFEWDARAKFTVEQTNQDRHNLTFLFTWLPRENIDFYVVLNDVRDEDEKERGIFSKVVYHF